MQSEYCSTYNQFLNEDSLSDTGTTEQTNLTTTGIWGEKIDDLDTSDENLGRGSLLDELGSIGVNGGHPDTLDRATLVNGVTSDVHNTAKGTRADRDLNGRTGINGLCTTDETLGTYNPVGILFKILHDKQTTVNSSRQRDDNIPSMAIVRTTPSPKCC